MTESVIELVVKDGDPEKVVAVACGTCRIVRLNKEVAAACCKKKECSVCGKNIERPRTICEPCQWAEADKKAAARQASNFNKAAKVLLKDYPHDIVCVSFFSDESDYLSIAEAMEPPDPEDDDSALS